MNKKVRVLIGGIIISTSVLMGCGNNKAVAPSDDPNEVVQDESRTEDLKKENGVIDGQVYVTNNSVIATMILKDEISDQDANKLAEKYAKDLEKTYKDLNVNVQAVKNGENVANIVKEK